ncbi:unnamed protein product [Notodromas monacha]|uniref:Phosphoinositide phospholipase C n=1 Tax=Notodromas monacha TaxID=399045 RepID=A0A7R9BGX7_9CRUS|nr:unnamed protein product [Notodromas monacha]CAG0914190.1 unnamed protein product [Notodromas monacha]
MWYSWTVFYFLIPICLSGPVLDGPYGKDLLACRENWLAVSKSPRRLEDCATKFFFAVKPHMQSSRGIPELNIPSVNPLALDEYRMGTDASLQGTLKEFKIYNITDSFIPERVKFSYDEQNKVMSLNIFAPLITGSSVYDMTINFGSLLGQAEAFEGLRTTGSSFVTIEDADVKLKVHFRTKKNGELAVSKSDCDLDVRSANMRFKSDKPDDPVGIMLNNLAKGEIGRVLVLDTSPPLSKQLALISTGLIFLLVTVSLECKGASVIGPKIEGAQEIKIDSIGSLENQFFPHRIYEESSIESRQESNVKEIPEALKVNIEENRLDQTVNDKGRTIYNVMGIRNEGPQGTFVMEDIYAFLERIWNPLTENLLQPLFQFLQLLVLAPFFARRAPDTINYAPNPLQRFNQDYIDEYPTVIGTVRQTELQESTQEAQESQSSVANWARVATGLVALEARQDDEPDVAGNVATLFNTMSMFLASVSELIQLINDIATIPENFRPNSTEANTELPFVIIETEDLVQETSTVTTKKPIEHMNIGGLSVDYISDSQVIYEDDGNAFQPHNAEKDAQPDIELDCTVKVDEYGFFVFWKSEGKEGQSVELTHVSDVKIGIPAKDSRLANQLSSRNEAYESKNVSLTYGFDFVNLSAVNFVTKSAEEAKFWKEQLLTLAHNSKVSHVCPLLALKKHWMRLRMSCDPDGKIPVRAVSKTFASGKTEKLVYQTLSDLGLPSDKNDGIPPDDFTFEKFHKIYGTICPRNDIEELFRSISDGKETITLAQFVEFMNEKQRDPRLNEILYPLYSEKRAREIIADYEEEEELKAKDELSKAGLIKYLMSDENAPVFLDKLDIYMDMDQPMSHYYINSSHNTYLIGRQFGAKSSTEIYRQVLLSGCRCVELDAWDGKGQDEEPIVTHGKAMCTEVLFKDCIQAIAETAFVESDYPVILSFENHCCLNQQYKLAKYCEEYFGDHLLKQPLPSNPLEKGVPLPSPNQLKRKILIKNKRLNPEVEKQELELWQAGQLKVDEVKEDAGDVNAPSDKDAGAEASGKADPVPGANYSGSSAVCHPYLSTMISYCQASKFQGFDVAEKNDIHYKMSSFAESAGLGYLKSQAIEFVNYNKRQFSRIYPKGTRADSSNYLPQIFWNAGCQMVSLNFQTSDLPMQLNQGKFEYNGNCGYLLKPDFMRRPDRTFDPFAETPVDGVIAARCSVQVVLPDLAVLRFGVYDENGKLLGQRILPLDGLQAGYRHIPLRTESNCPLSLPMLFCNIDLKIYIPEGLGDFMDALSDPRAFLSAQEKRTQQMKAMGIEESDISTADLKLGQSSSEGGKVTGQQSKPDEMTFEQLTALTFAEDKTYAKLIKKQTKELEAMQKRQTKERAALQKTQNAAYEKMAKSCKNKEKAHEDESFCELIKSHIERWTEMCESHQNEESSLKQAHVKQQEEALIKLFEIAQIGQMKQLEVKHDKDNKEMRARQAKVSVETAKEVANDKGMKNKAEKDRLMKERTANNTKKFIEERKTAAIQQDKEKTKLEKTHKEQVEKVQVEKKQDLTFYSFSQMERDMEPQYLFYM